MQSYQIRETGMDSFTANSDYIQVSENGKVQPRMKSIPSLTGSSDDPKYKEGDYTVTASGNGKTLQYMFHLHDYAKIYAYELLDEYLEQNTNQNMTVLDRVNAVTAYFGEREFTYGGYQKIEELVILKAGNCYAASKTVQYMCDRLGIISRIRDASGDPGAQRNHRNNVIACPPEKTGEAYQFYIIDVPVENPDDAVIYLKSIYYECDASEMFKGVRTGDCNGDRKCTAADAEMLRNWLLCLPGAGISDRFAADCDRNLCLDARDLTLLKRNAV